MFQRFFPVDLTKKCIAITNIDFTNEALFIDSIYCRTNQDFLVVTSTLYEANKLYDILSSMNEHTLFFPMDDFLTSEAIAISPEFKVIRMNTLNILSKKHAAKIVVTHLMGALRYLPQPEKWQESILTISKNDMISYKEFQTKLFDLGYTKTSLVTNTGEIGIRGFVVDIFPMTYKNPVRLEFFGDEIDSIREFDPDTQKSIRELDTITIYPFHEFLVDDSSVLESEMKQKYLPKYSHKVASLLGYLENPRILFHEYSMMESSYLKLSEEIFQYQQETKEHTEYMHPFSILHSNQEFYVLNLDSLLKDISFDAVYTFETADVPRYQGNYQKLKEDIDRYLCCGKTVILSLQSKTPLRHLEEYLGDYVITKKDQIYQNKVNIILNYASYGFLLGDYVVFTEKELHDYEHQKKKQTIHYRFGTKIKDVHKLNLGDYVVHASHGIGIYEGITTLTKNGIAKDYLQVKYQGNDKLYIPVEKIDLISKYSSKEGCVPKINKLGGTEWSKMKQRVRAKVKDIADQLLKLYAMLKERRCKVLLLQKIRKTKLLLNRNLPMNRQRISFWQQNKLKRICRAEFQWIGYYVAM